MGYLYEKMYNKDGDTDSYIMAFGNERQCVVSDTSSWKDIDMRNTSILIRSIEQADALVEAITACRMHLIKQQTIGDKHD